MTSHRLTTTTLPNGLRIAVVPDSRAATVTALVLVHVGSSFEISREGGLSHFLEHMCFKGTERRPSAKIIAEEIESLGAVTNAFTDREFTGYFVKGGPTHIETFVDILADIYQHSTFPESEIEKEKGVIVEEINMYEDMPQAKVNDILMEMLYPTHAMGRSVLGSKETVRATKRHDFLSYTSRYYTAANTTIVFAGNVTAVKARALAKKYFGTLPKAKKSRRDALSSAQKTPLVKLFPKATDQSHCILAFRSIPLGHKDSAAVRVLATILGKGMSSRLSLLLREELGAAYYVYATQESFVDGGVFSISFGIDKTRLIEISQRVIDECRALKEKKIEAKELAKAKEYAIGTLLLGLELSDENAAFYGAQMVLEQKIKTPREVIAAIKKVSAADVLRIATILFQSKGANLAVLGPYKESDLPKGLLETL